jgi:hypothetical protein
MLIWLLAVVLPIFVLWGVLVGLFLFIARRSARSTRNKAIRSEADSSPLGWKPPKALPPDQS